MVICHFQAQIQALQHLRELLLRQLIPCTPGAQPVKAQKTLAVQADNIVEYREYSLQSRLPFGPFQRNALDHIVPTNVVFYQSHQRDR